MVQLFRRIRMLRRVDISSENRARWLSVVRERLKWIPADELYVVLLSGAINFMTALLATYIIGLASHENSTADVSLGAARVSAMAFLRYRSAAEYSLEDTRSGIRVVHPRALFSRIRVSSVTCALPRNRNRPHF